MSQGTHTRRYLIQSHTFSKPLTASSFIHSTCCRRPTRTWWHSLVQSHTRILMASHSLIHCHRPFNTGTWTHSTTPIVPASLSRSYSQHSVSQTVTGPDSTTGTVPKSIQPQAFTTKWLGLNPVRWVSKHILTHGKSPTLSHTANTLSQPLSLIDYAVSVTGLSYTRCGLTLSLRSPLQRAHV